MDNLHNDLKFIDLFCGIGGFHQALVKHNYKCVMACDIDDKCREIYKENYGIEPEKDIKKVDEKKLPDFDILCAGFPCFIAGTKVLSYDGYKNIEDININDKLLTHTGKFQNIVNLQNKTYSGDLYELNIKYHPEIITCTEEHPFYIREKIKVWDNSINKYKIYFNEPVWKNAKELTNNDYIGMVINNNETIPEFNFIKKINQHKNIDINIKLDKKEEWFMMGYFIGDGWIEDTKKENGNTIYKIRFAINNKDNDEVVNIINKVIPITNKKCDSGSKCKKYGCVNYIWYNIFKMFGKYAHGKLIPEWVQDAPKELIQEFINGYMKADGCIRENVLVIGTVSYNLAFGLQRLYLKLGHIFGVNKNIRPKTCIIEGRTVNQRDSYTVRGILEKKTKTESSFIEDNYVWYAPFKINKIETLNTQVYNFEVQNDNSYIVENNIVHNCQSYSNGGKKGGLKDPRGTLFEDILRIANEKKPKFMFLENVKHIKKIDDGKTFNHIIKRINETGYYVNEKDTIFELSPHNLGIPQQRERVIFVCINNDIYDKDKIIDFKLPNIKIDITKIIETDKTLTDKYKISKDTENILNIWDEMVQIFDVNETLSPTILCNEFYKEYTDEELKALPMWKQDYIKKNKPLYKKYKKQWDEWYEKHRETLQKKEINGKLEWQTGKKKPNDSIWNYFIQLRQSGIRVKKTDYFPTLVAIVQTPIYAKEKRYITPRECARLQSFPDSFIMHKSDNVAYKQFGNAVNVDVVSYIIDLTLKSYSII